MTVVHHLREIIDSGRVVSVAGAHDAVSARLAELAGFEAVWLSSLGVSTAFRALPDINLLTVSEALQVARNVTLRISIPLIADCENGYGDENNVRHAIREFERAGVSAVCIDDNGYPKRNSFYSSNRSLVSIDSMIAKIHVARETRSSENFVLIARTEALIAGFEISEAVERATAYVKAGADALLIHSRQWAEIKSFLASWDPHLAPVVVVPTAFPEISFDELCDAGCKVIIYANQSLRASIKAMQEVLHTLLVAKTRIEIESKLTPLAELENIVSLRDFTVGEPD
jgi:phosphoenolpyruvate phosphomutase